MAAESAAVSHDLSLPSQAEIDAALEREIETAHRAYLCAVEMDDVPSIRESFDVMAALLAQRSLAQVERLERERGLR